MLPVICPSTVSRFKAWWTTLTDICECLLKGAWEGLITAKPTVETNINWCEIACHQSQDLLFTSREINQPYLRSDAYKTFHMLSWHIPLKWASHSGFWAPWVKQMAARGIFWQIQLLVKISHYFQIIIQHSSQTHPWVQPIIGQKHPHFFQCWESNPWICIS